MGVGRFGPNKKAKMRGASGKVSAAIKKTPIKA
jgi:hypothetical protein